MNNIGYLKTNAQNLLNVCTKAENYIQYYRTWEETQFILNFKNDYNSKTRLRNRSFWVKILKLKPKPILDELKQAKDLLDELLEMCLKHEYFIEARKYDYQSQYASQTLSNILTILGSFDSTNINNDILIDVEVYNKILWCSKQSFDKSILI